MNKLIYCRMKEKETAELKRKWVASLFAFFSFSAFKRSIQPIRIASTPGQNWDRCRSISVGEKKRFVAADGVSENLGDCSTGRIPV